MFGLSDGWEWWICSVCQSAFILETAQPTIFFLIRETIWVYGNLFISIAIFP